MSSSPFHQTPTRARFIPRYDPIKLEPKQHAPLPEWTQPPYRQALIELLGRDILNDQAFERPHTPQPAANERSTTHADTKPKGNRAWVFFFGPDQDHKKTRKLEDVAAGLLDALHDLHTVGSRLIPNDNKENSPDRGRQAFRRSASDLHMKPLERFLFMRYALRRSKTLCWHACKLSGHEGDVYLQKIAHGPKGGLGYCIQSCRSVISRAKKSQAAKAMTAALDMAKAVASSGGQEVSTTTPASTSEEVDEEEGDHDDDDLLKSCKGTDDPVIRRAIKHDLKTSRDAKIRLLEDETVAVLEEARRSFKHGFPSSISSQTAPAAFSSCGSASRHPVFNLEAKYNAHGLRQDLQVHMNLAPYQSFPTTCYPSPSRTPSHHRPTSQQQTFPPPPDSALIFPIDRHTVGTSERAVDTLGDFQRCSIETPVSRFAMSSMSSMSSSHSQPRAFHAPYAPEGPPTSFPRPAVPQWDRSTAYHPAIAAPPAPPACPRAFTPLVEDPVVPQSTTYTQATAAPPTYTPSPMGLTRPPAQSPLHILKHEMRLAHGILPEPSPYIGSVRSSSGPMQPHPAQRLFEGEEQQLYTGILLPPLGRPDPTFYGRAWQVRTNEPPPEPRHPFACATGPDTLKHLKMLDGCGGI